MKEKTKQEAGRLDSVCCIDKALQIDHLTIDEDSHSFWITGVWIMWRFYFLSVIVRPCGSSGFTPSAQVSLHCSVSLRIKDANYGCSAAVFSRDWHRKNGDFAADWDNNSELEIDTKPWCCHTYRLQSGAHTELILKWTKPGISGIQGWLVSLSQLRGTRDATWK